MTTAATAASARKVPETFVFLNLLKVVVDLLSFYLLQGLSTLVPEKFFNLFNFYFDWTQFFDPATQFLYEIFVLIF